MYIVPYVLRAQASFCVRLIGRRMTHAYSIHKQLNSIQLYSYVMILILELIIHHCAYDIMYMYMLAPSRCCHRLYDYWNRMIIDVTIPTKYNTSAALSYINAAEVIFERIKVADGSLYDIGIRSYYNSFLILIYPRNVCIDSIYLHMQIPERIINYTNKPWMFHQYYLYYLYGKCMISLNHYLSSASDCKCVGIICGNVVTDALCASNSATVHLLKCLYMLTAYANITTSYENLTTSMQMKRIHACYCMCINCILGGRIHDYKRIFSLNDITIEFYIDILQSLLRLFNNSC